jgi:adenylate kinase
MNVILIGAQGSGKGTQAQFISSEMNLKHTASGDLLRDAIAQGTPSGLAAKSYYERGDLVPDEIMVGMILDAISDLGGKAGLLLDGFPRTLAQARILDVRLAERGQRVDKVIYLQVPRQQLVERLASRYLCRAHGHIWNIASLPPKVPGICDYDGSELYQRSDDTGEAVTRRLDIFFTETITLVDYYAQMHKEATVDGSGTIEQVHAAVRAALR